MTITKVNFPWGSVDHLFMGRETSVGDLLQAHYLVAATVSRRAWTWCASLPPLSALVIQIQYSAYGVMVRPEKPLDKLN